VNHGAIESIARANMCFDKNRTAMHRRLISRTRSPLLMFKIYEVIRTYCL